MPFQCPQCNSWQVYGAKCEILDFRVYISTSSRLYLKVRVQKLSSCRYSRYSNVDYFIPLKIFQLKIMMLRLSKPVEISIVLLMLWFFFNRNNDITWIHTQKWVRENGRSATKSRVDESILRKTHNRQRTSNSRFTAAYAKNRKWIQLCIDSKRQCCNSASFTLYLTSIFFQTIVIRTMLIIFKFQSTKSTRFSVSKVDGDSPLPSPTSPTTSTSPDNFSGIAQVQYISRMIKIS